MFHSLAIFFSFPMFAEAARTCTLASHVKSLPQQPIHFTYMTRIFLLNNIPAILLDLYIYLRFF